jgi:phosphoglycerol transferase MdoB-like AlkP superfamily enzyme
MTTRHILLRFSLIAGLAIASATWAVNMQLGEILPYLDCRHQQRFSAIASFAALLLTAAATVLSWRASRRAAETAPLTAASSFIGALSALCALVFVFALSMQTVASLVLSGCER